MTDHCWHCGTELDNGACPHCTPSRVSRSMADSRHLTPDPVGSSALTPDSSYSPPRSASETYSHNGACLCYACTCTRLHEHAMRAR